MAGDLGLLAFTLAVAACATAFILPFGVAVALLLAHWRGRGRSLLETALALPLVLPPTAVGLLLLELFGRMGPLGSALDAIGLEVVFTWKAVVLAASVMSFPLLVRSARTAFEEVDPRLSAIARTLGHGRLGVLARVELPLAWRGILAGALLAFARALGEFGATILVAGNIPGRTQTLSLAIFHRVQLGRDAEAMRLVALSTALAFLAIWGTEWVTRERARRLAR
ncbi:MAG: molybdate ABC transporter permease subunit [Myxococcales bacterium]|nr:molybdate ABC transporter permease subunit [Myxococcales bacterium]